MMDIQEEKIIEEFFRINPHLKEQIKIKRIKFALNEKQRKELLDIAESSNYTHYLIIKLMMETGLRVNEAINLDIRQLNLGNEPMIVIQSRQSDKYSRSFKTKTLSSNRVIPITKKLSKILKAYIGNRKKGYVFISQKKSKYLKNSVIGFINRYAKKCKSLGFNIGSHALRRTYASYLLQNKVKISDISKLLGHSSIKTTLNYLYEIEQPNFIEIRKIIKKMNK
ncbi:MAG: tyrosine-type recombinase/integrase [Promethearchaeota archaeon]